MIVAQRIEQVLATDRDCMWCRNSSMSFSVITKSGWEDSLPNR
jgi:hypothetical protein